MIEKAVVPVAGLGTRMLPITKSIPKEMLPVGRKPMIQIGVEELALSGIREVCIVIRQGKEVIKDYLLSGYPYLEKADGSIEELEKLTAGIELSFVYQERALGLGDAMLKAKDFVGDNPFVLLVPDQIMQADIPPTKQLLNHYRDNLPSIWTGLVKFPKEELPYFVGARGVEYEELREDEVRIEKLYSEEEMAVVYRDKDFEVRGFGRTIYPPDIFAYLDQRFINPATGEVDLLKTFEECRGKIPHYGLLLEGAPFDLGTFEGYYRYMQEIWRRRAVRGEWKDDEGRYLTA